VTGPRALCAHVACTDARRISVQTETAASIYGTPDLHFSVFENVRNHSLHGIEHTANAVWE